jgi:putative ATP-binding cassette transporter
MTTRTRQTFGLGTPFWLHSANRKSAWLLLAVLVGLVAAYTGLLAWNTQLQKGFYDALQQRNAEAFYNNIVLLFAAIILLVSVAVLRSYMEQALEMRWRCT